MESEVDSRLCAPEEHGGDSDDGGHVPPLTAAQIQQVEQVIARARTAERKHLHYAQSRLRRRQTEMGDEEGEDDSTAMQQTVETGRQLLQGRANSTFVDALPTIAGLLAMAALGVLAGAKSL